MRRESTLGAGCVCTAFSRVGENMAKGASTDMEGGLVLEVAAQCAQEHTDLGGIGSGEGQVNTGVYPIVILVMVKRANTLPLAMSVKGGDSVSARSVVQMVSKV